jgi:tetratricopeptide (TPR) repeat protein
MPVAIAIAAVLLAGSGWAGAPQPEATARAASLAESGWRLLRNGDYPRAAQAFREASTLAPGDPSLLIGLGVSQHLLARDEQAAAAFRKALARDPGATLAHTFLGDIYDQQGNVEAALRHYEIAARQDPNDAGIKGRLLAARRAAEAEAGLDRLFSAHFIIKFHRTADRAVAGAVADRLEAIFRTVGAQWSYFPTSRVVVVLHSPGHVQEAVWRPDWALALFDGQIHLPLERVSGDPASAEAALRHEYMHVVVHRLSGGQAPAWLHEGLALYMERGPDAAGAWTREIGLIRAGERPPLAALHRSFLELPAGEAALAYAESYGAARALLKRHGPARVRRLLESLPLTSDFAEAFEAVFHERYSDFDAAWPSTVEE